MTSGRSARNSFQAVAEVCPETFAMLATEKDKTNTQLSQDKGGQEGKYIYIYIYSVPAPYKPYHDCWAECTLQNVVPNPTESDKVVPDEKICR